MKRTLCVNTGNWTKLSLHYAKEFQGILKKKSAPLIMSVKQWTWQNINVIHKSKKNPLLITETCKGLSGNTIGSIFEGGNTAAMSSKWMQTFLQHLVTFSNKMEHRRLTFLENFFFPCCDQKSDSEVNNHKIKQKHTHARTRARHTHTHTHTDFSLIYLMAVSAWL